jgi:hypothetical protein
MILIKTVRKSTLLVALCLVAAIAAAAILPPFLIDSQETFVGEEWSGIMADFFQKRNDSLRTGDCLALRSVYALSEQNGSWAYEQEVRRAGYLKKWSDRQGVSFTAISSRLDIRRVKKVGRGYAFYIVVSTDYTYAYRDDPGSGNSFRIGTCHTMDLIPAASEGTWLISREWYLDPFMDSLGPGHQGSADISRYIASHQAVSLPPLSQRRAGAVAYADRYCGAASSDGPSGKYNTAYRDFNGLGGDCTNFTSQVLHEGGGFKKTSEWNYSAGAASRAWGNAQGFKDYMLYSGRASLLAKGTFEQVCKKAYSLSPGDVIAYEEKGRVVHTGVVSGLDSKGYPLVNTHTVDRFRVPWDMGWNDDGIRFWLMKVNYK